MNMSVHCMMRGLAVALCPMLVLGGVQVWLSSHGPATASAQAVSEPIAQPDFHRLAALSDVQQAAFDRMNAIGNAAPPNPFPELATPELFIPDPELPSDPDEPTPAIDPPPELIVTSILGGRVPVAMVNGRPRSVGDEVWPGWVIQEITTNGIVISHLDGRSARFDLLRKTP